LSAPQKPLGRRSRFVRLAVVLLVVGLGLWVATTLLRPPSTTDWGPLAVARTPEQPAARAEGIVRITDTCVGLVAPGGGGALLVWPADRVEWLASDRVVRFRNLDARVHLLRDGAAVVLQGGGGAVGADGRPIDRDFDWLAPPRPGCGFDEYFLVADIMGS
jgi:hypothetical protein